MFCGEGMIIIWKKVVEKKEELEMCGRIGVLFLEIVKLRGGINVVLI